MKGLGFLLLSFVLLGFLCNPASADCSVYARSSSGLAVSGAEVIVTNTSNGGVVFDNLTSLSGGVSVIGDCNSTNISVQYPSSAYSAVIGNVSVSSSVYLDDYVSGELQLRNTLGQPLEGQDCSVAAYLANGSDLVLVKDYSTQCLYKPDLVCPNGVCNYAAVIDCPFTDSDGWYRFRGKVLESEGFQYNRLYRLTFVCNAQIASANFTTGLSRGTDMDKWGDWISSQGGFIVLGVISIIGLVVFVAFLVLAYNFVTKRRFPSSV
jgi:hypothetical protein